MTARKAKKISLEIWRYLAEHPDIERKYHLPERLYNKIAGLECFCPLCELFYGENENAICPGCPLKRCNEGSTYERWFCAPSAKARQKYAQKIVDVIEAWRPKEKRNDG